MAKNDSTFFAKIRLSLGTFNMNIYRYIAIHQVISVNSAIVIFNLTALIIIRIQSPLLFLHCEVTLKTIINRNSVRIHISEEKVPPVKRFAHICQCTACQIRIKPADSAYKKLCTYCLKHQASTRPVHTAQSEAYISYKFRAQVSNTEHTCHSVATQ